MKRLRVGIIFGGRSVEHDVSLVSARSVLAAMDPKRYDVVPIGVTREGKWLTSSEVRRFLDDGLSKERGDHAALAPDPSVVGLVALDGAGEPGRARGADVSRLDVVFPLIHGGYGEDGKLQGLLEMADLPYVGSGVLGSALGMDKEVAKRLCGTAGLPQLPYISIRRAEWRKGSSDATDADGQEIRGRLERLLGYPCFVKPAGLGSSVGVSKAGNWAAAAAAIDDAFTYDEKVLVERGLDAREIEVAILGNEEPSASVCGEIVTGHAFYDYEAKYHDDTTRLLIPAPIPEVMAESIRSIALEAFQVLELWGMARVDFLVDRSTGETYLNEVNTIPGFTPVSMYPKLWEASGIAYGTLVDRLVELALERHEAKHRLRVTRPE